MSSKRPGRRGMLRHANSCDQPPITIGLKSLGSGSESHSARPVLMASMAGRIEELLPCDQERGRNSLQMRSLQGRHLPPRESSRMFLSAAKRISRTASRQTPVRSRRSWTALRRAGSLFSRASQIVPHLTRSNWRRPILTFNKKEPTKVYNAGGSLSMIDLNQQIDLTALRRYTSSLNAKAGDRVE